MNISLFFTILAVGFFVAVPIGVVFAGISILPNLLSPSFPFTAEAALRSMVSGLDSFPILAIPLFMLSGVIMAGGKISEKIFNFFAFFVGNKTAGFPCAVVITCLFYGAISGSGPATTAAVGSMAIPFLTGMGYDLIFASALVAVAGGLGVIIPPSIPFIVYSSVANTSTSNLFIAGILPGILIAFFLCLYAWIYCKKHGEDKVKLLANYNAIRSKGFKAVFLDSFWALLTPVIILGSIYGGIASPTEAAGISIFYALIVSMVIYKTIKPKDFIHLLQEGVKTYSAILFIIATAVCFGRVLALLRISAAVSASIMSMTTTKFGVLLFINIILLLAGMVADPLVSIMILTPVFLPVVNAMHIDLIHFGILMVCNLAVGFVTPPMGMNLFVTSNLTGVPAMKLAKTVMPFIGFFFGALILINVFPALSLALIRK